MPDYQDFRWTMGCCGCPKTEKKCRSVWKWFMFIRGMSTCISIVLGLSCADSIRLEIVCVLNRWVARGYRSFDMICCGCVRTIHSSIRPRHSSPLFSSNEENLSTHPSTSSGIISLNLTGVDKTGKRYPGQHVTKVPLEGTPILRKWIGRQVIHHHCIQCPLFNNQ